MIPNVATNAQYAGDGVTTSFPFPNKIFAATDLQVTLINNVTKVATQQFLFSNYTIPQQNIDVDTGSAVIFNSAPPPTVTVDIRSVIPENQLTSIKNQGAFLPELHEEAFDKVTRIVQDLFRRTYTFGIHGPDNELVAWPALPSASARAGAYLAFDQNGLPALASGAGGGGGITQAQFNALLQASPGWPQGVYEAQFGYGNIQFIGPNNALAADKNLGYGSLVPNPTGTPGPFLLLGSGGGGGTYVTFVIGTDQAFDNVTPGNTLLITAGETQAAGTAAGGLLWLIGGASFGGTGGEMLIQGGTSLNGPGGIAVLQGGNSTNGIAPPGDAFVSGGQAGYTGGGNQGANVHLIATLLSGKTGVIRLRQNSNIMADFIPQTTSGTGGADMALYLYAQPGGGNAGYGVSGAPLVSGGVSSGLRWFTAGFTGSITFGTGHTMTVANGLITAYS